MRTDALPDGRITAPAAARNAEPIAQVLLAHAPASGRALELASGTGQHVALFAHLTPGLTWQPSDPDPVRRRSIAAWIAHSGAANILPPRDIDACAPGWAAAEGPTDLILVVNLLHLVSRPAAETLLDEAAMALAPGGTALIYGPFLRDGQATSDGDAAFDASLRAADPATGYKDIEWVTDRLTGAGLTLVAVEEMPANNLCLVVRA
ncbi:DUF938 domain-containing protein [Rhodobacterales bacterium HKCCE2091]|nr:DUF938 domain-containing protein [Rhodobacterales bacterium HKCCE2091]